MSKHADRDAQALKEYMKGILARGEYGKVTVNIKEGQVVSLKYERSIEFSEILTKAAAMP